MSPPTAYIPRVAIVTGSAQGIGYCIAHRLADDGLDVAINDLPEKKEKCEEVAKELQAKGRRSIAIVGDVSMEEDVKALVEKTVEVLGGLDCVSSL
jgi:NAD(P)-dependent dehydrogenase (short-subunit alcohol dehydrogenase family)